MTMVPPLPKLGERYDPAKDPAHPFGQKDLDKLRDEIWTEPLGEERERLYWLAEELTEALAEAHKVTMKILRFGYEEVYEGETNRDRLENELGDVFAVMTLMARAGDISADNLDLLRKRKMEKLNAFRRNHGKPAVSGE